MQGEDLFEFKKNCKIPVTYRKQFSKIPKELFDYLDKLLIKEDKTSSFYKACLEHPKATFKSINFQFDKASEITSLTNKELLTSLDFNKHDICPTRIESLLGELRTIIILDKNNFKEIKPIKANKNKKSADFVALFGLKTIYIEVATSIRFCSRTFHDSIVQWAISRLRKDNKIQQMNLDEPDCYNLFVMIINTSIAVALNDRNDYLNILKSIHKEFKENRNLSFALFTGRSTNGKEDDCIYPSIPNVQQNAGANILPKGG